jgi:hypothetical protein
MTLKRSLLAWIALTGAFAPPAGATPRHSLVVGQKCSLCHFNPTGGGQRSLYGSQYLLPERLAMKFGEEAEGSGSGLNPQLGEDLVVGADLRTFYFEESDRDAEDPAIGKRLNNFVEMQGSVYLSFQLDERFSAYIHQEFGQSRANVQAYEIYGMGFVLPANGYVKAGKFVPSYGWKQADHRSFTRTQFVFLPAVPPHSDQGLEIGFQPLDFEIQAAVVNGNYRSGFDTDGDVAIVGRGSWRWSPGSLNLAAGGSTYFNEHSSGERFTGGPFGGFHWDRLTWLGEFDWANEKPDAGRETQSFTTSQELAVRIVQGFDAVATYDFHDPDVDLESGSLARLGFGFEAIPRPFLAIRAMVNFFNVDAVDPEVAPDVALPPEYRADFDQFVGQLHFFY